MFRFHGSAVPEYRTKTGFDSVIHGIVLAAGLGRRVGIPKALLLLHGRTFHQRAVQTFLDVGLQAVVVVSPAIVKGLPMEVLGESRVINPDPDQESGMLGSVKLGVDSAIRLGATGLILLPVDHPLVTREDVLSVADHLRQGAPIAVSTHEGRRGHPIGISREVMEEISQDGDLVTLRDIVRKDPGRVVLVPASEGAILGVNTPDDLDRVRNRPFR